MKLFYFLLRWNYKLITNNDFFLRMIDTKKKYLFLVFLGGRAKKANVEVHDVRWVIGSKIEDTYDVLKSDWFGNLKGLHIYS